MLTSQLIIADLFSSLYSFISFVLHMLQLAISGAWASSVVIVSWWIDPFVVMKWPSLSLIIFIAPKSKGKIYKLCFILIKPPQVFKSNVVIVYFPSYFSFCPHYAFYLTLAFKKSNQTTNNCCLLIGIFRPFMFNVVIAIVGYKFIFLLFISIFHMFFILLYFLYLLVCGLKIFYESLLTFLWAY